MKKKSSIKTICYVACMASVISVMAPLSLPLSTGVPISLATLAIMLSGIVLGSKNGAIAVGIYLILGALGIPVFANYTAGISILFGVTGGFLFGYIPLAYFCGYFYERKQTIPYMILGMCIGNALLYLMGTLWFMFVAKTTIINALMICVIPFLLGDLAKMCVIGILVPKLNRILSKIYIYKKTAITKN